MDATNGWQTWLPKRADKHGYQKGLTNMAVKHGCQTWMHILVLYVEQTHE